MKTLDRLDHEEARQALALFSQMEVAAKGRDVDAILAASTNMVAETILRGCDSRKEAERIADDVAAKLSETIAYRSVGFGRHPYFPHRPAQQTLHPAPPVQSELFLHS